MSTPQKDMGSSPVSDAFSAGISSTNIPVDVLDPKHLEQLRALRVDSKHSLFYELSAIFRREGAPRLLSIKEAINRKDSEAVARLAHAFVGSSASIGARQLQKAMKTMELAAMNSDWSIVESTVCEVDSAWGCLMSALERCDREEVA